MMTAATYWMWRRLTARPITRLMAKSTEAKINTITTQPMTMSSTKATRRLIGPA